MTALEQFRATITACTTKELEALAVKAVVDGSSNAKVVFAGVVTELKKRTAIDLATGN